jgi:anti-sigma factor RsiW
MKANDLSCQELVELVTDYLENELPAGQRERFEAHLTGCDGCVAYLEEMRMAIELSGRLEPELLSDEAREVLLGAFRGWQT